MTTAKLFWNGRSQAVRLPEASRFEGDEVRIRREGRAVVLEPIEPVQPTEGDWDWLFEIRRRFSDDFMRDGRDQPPMLPDKPLFDD